MKFTKEKNILTIDIEDGKKPYTFDINTATMYGRNGRKLIHVPKEIAHFWETCRTKEFHPNRVIRLLVGADVSNADDVLGRSEIFRLADKMDSLGYVSEEWASLRTWEMLASNEKFVIQTIVKEPYLRLEKIYSKVLLENLFQEFDVERRTFSEIELKHLDYLSDCLSRSCFSYCKKYFDYYCYYLKQGLVEIDSISTIMEEYFKKCEALGIVPEKTIFTKTNAAIAQLYREKQQKIQEKKLSDYYCQMKDKLFFEDDTFMVVVPDSPMDFHEEAKQQDNCVERIYMGKVINGETNVVFIRKKENPKKSYITCEVSNKGKIEQFLLSYNRRVIDACDLRFKNEYQNFLDTTMGQ